MNTLEEFKSSLLLAEYAASTISKYYKDVQLLLEFVGQRPLDKDALISYKRHLETILSPGSVNRKIAAINRYLDFIGQKQLALKSLRIQTFHHSELELTKTEFQRLVRCAHEIGKARIALIVSTLAGTGIRISELRYITVKAIQTGVANIHNKGKFRTIILPKQLQYVLLRYCRDEGINAGIIFTNADGLPLSRPYLATELKKIALAAGVDPHKAFPHNFRRFFARRFLESGAPITDLADHLGHSNINTTRRYLSTSTATKKKQLARMEIFPEFDFGYHPPAAL